MDHAVKLSCLRLNSHPQNTVQRRHYDSNDYMDEKREALQRWNDHLLQIIDNAADNVVQITA